MLIIIECIASLAGVTAACGAAAVEAGLGMLIYPLIQIIVS
jgi:hypothetical protein